MKALLHETDSYRFGEVLMGIESEFQLDL